MPMRNERQGDLRWLEHDPVTTESINKRHSPSVPRFMAGKRGQMKRQPSALIAAGTNRLVILRGTNARYLGGIGAAGDGVTGVVAGDDGVPDIIGIGTDGVMVVFIPGFSSSGCGVFTHSTCPSR